MQVYCKDEKAAKLRKESSDGNSQHQQRSVDLVSWIVYIVPGALYSLNNNLVVHIQHYTDPATFQVLSWSTLVSLILFAVELCFNVYQSPRFSVI